MCNHEVDCETAETAQLRRLQELQQENEALRAQLEKSEFSRRNLKMRIYALQKVNQACKSGFDPAYSVKYSPQLSIELRLADGSYRNVGVGPAVGDLLLLYARLCCILTEGTGCSHSELDDLNVSIREEGCELVHKIPTMEREASFRLGQMDMKESIVAMLDDHSVKIGPGVVGGTVRAVADMVRAMEVPNGRAPIENT